LNNVLDGFGDERRFESFFDSRVVGPEEFSEPIGDSDDKGEGTFEQQGDSRHLS
jgi:hypothetical protein